jgi:arylsulfatase A-like enzyme
LRVYLSLLGFLLLLPGCGEPDSQQTAADAHPVVQWAPGIHDLPIQSERGQTLHGRSEYLTYWYGLETDRLKSRAPALLSDNRDALAVHTPHQFWVDLAATTKTRQLTTAVRRSGSHPRQALHCEVFWQNQGQLQSLAIVSLDPDPTQVSEAWHEIVVPVPSEAGRLQFISRNPSPGAASKSPIALAWMSPRVEPLEAAEELPDILLLTIDTLRSDALQHAPQLSARLRRGAFWPQAVAPSNWTLPSYGSLFTGLPADAHGAGRGRFADLATGLNEDRQLSPLNPELPTLAQHLRQAGYATAMVHQNPMLESWAGLTKGFEQYVRASDRNLDALNWARQWWQNNAHRPRFLVVHLMAPHLPYRSGPEPDPIAQLETVRFFGEDHSPQQRAEFFALSESLKDIVRARYASEVAQLDRDLAPFLEQILSSNEAPPIFAFHVDHGEELWDDGSFEHGHSFDDSVIRVPVALQYANRIEAGLHPEAVPAYGLSGSLLDLVGLEHDFAVKLFDPPREFQSSMPLYRSKRGGRSYSSKGAHDLAFDVQVRAGGPAAAITVEQMRMLQELGYLAGKELKPTAKEK